MPLASSMGMDDGDFDPAARAKIEDVIKKNKIVLFMKGNK
jgi:hypothetical protein